MPPRGAISRAGRGRGSAAHSAAPAPPAPASAPFFPLTDAMAHAAHAHMTSGVPTDPSVRATRIGVSHGALCNVVGFVHSCDPLPVKRGGSDFKQAVHLRDASVTAESGKEDLQVMFFLSHPSDFLPVCPGDVLALSDLPIVYSPGLNRAQAIVNTHARNRVPHALFRIYPRLPYHTPVTPSTASSARGANRPPPPVPAAVSRFLYSRPCPFTTACPPLPPSSLFSSSSSGDANAYGPPVPAPAAAMHASRHGTLLWPFHTDDEVVFTPLTGRGPSHGSNTALDGWVLVRIGDRHPSRSLPLLTETGTPPSTEAGEKSGSAGKGYAPHHVAVAAPASTSAASTRARAAHAASLAAYDAASSAPGSMSTPLSGLRQARAQARKAHALAVIDLFKSEHPRTPAPVPKPADWGGGAALRAATGEANVRDDEDVRGEDGGRETPWPLLAPFSSTPSCVSLLQQCFEAQVGYILMRMVAIGEDISEFTPRPVKVEAGGTTASVAGAPSVKAEPTPPSNAVTAAAASAAAAVAAVEAPAPTLSSCARDSDGFAPRSKPAGVAPGSTTAEDSLYSRKRPAPSSLEAGAPSARAGSGGLAAALAPARSHARPRTAPSPAAPVPPNAKDCVDGAGSASRLQAPDQIVPSYTARSAAGSKALTVVAAGSSPLASGSNAAAAGVVAFARNGTSVSLGRPAPAHTLAPAPVSTPVPPPAPVPVPASAPVAAPVPVTSPAPTQTREVKTETVILLDLTPDVSESEAVPAAASVENAASAQENASHGVHLTPSSDAVPLSLRAHPRVDSSTPGLSGGLSTYDQLSGSDQSRGSIDGAIYTAPLSLMHSLMRSSSPGSSSQEVALSSQQSSLLSSLVSHVCTPPSSAPPSPSRTIMPPLPCALLRRLTARLLLKSSRVSPAAVLGLSSPCNSPESSAKATDSSSVDDSAAASLSSIAASLSASGGGFLFWRVSDVLASASPAAVAAAACEVALAAAADAAAGICAYPTVDAAEPLDAALRHAASESQAATTFLDGDHNWGGFGSVIANWEALASDLDFDALPGFYGEQDEGHPTIRSPTLAELAASSANDSCNSLVEKALLALVHAYPPSFSRGRGRGRGRAWVLARSLVPPPAFDALKLAHSRLLVPADLAHSTEAGVSVSPGYLVPLLFDPHADIPALEKSSRVTEMLRRNVPADGGSKVSREGLAVMLAGAAWSRVLLQGAAGGEGQAKELAEGSQVPRWPLPMSPVQSLSFLPQPQSQPQQSASIAAAASSGVVSLADAVALTHPALTHLSPHLASGASSTAVVGVLASVVAFGTLHPVTSSRGESTEARQLVPSQLSSLARTQNSATAAATAAAAAAAAAESVGGTVYVDLWDGSTLTSPPPYYGAPPSLRYGADRPPHPHYGSVVRVLLPSPAPRAFLRRLSTAAAAFDVIATAAAAFGSGSHCDAGAGKGVAGISSCVVHLRVMQNPTLPQYPPTSPPPLLRVPPQTSWRALPPLRALPLRGSGTAVFAPASSRATAPASSAVGASANPNAGAGTGAGPGAGAGTASMSSGVSVLDGTALEVVAAVAMASAAASTAASPNAAVHSKWRCSWSSWNAPVAALKTSLLIAGSAALAGYRKQGLGLGRVWAAPAPALLPCFDAPLRMHAEHGLCTWQQHVARAITAAAAATVAATSPTSAGNPPLHGACLPHAPSEPWLLAPWAALHGALTSLSTLDAAQDPYTVGNCAALGLVLAVGWHRHGAEDSTFCPPVGAGWALLWDGSVEHTAHHERMLPRWLQPQHGTVFAVPLPTHEGQSQWLPEWARPGCAVMVTRTASGQDYRLIMQPLQPDLLSPAAVAASLGAAFFAVGRPPLGLALVNSGASQKVECSGGQEVLRALLTPAGFETAGEYDKEWGRAAAYFVAAGAAVDGAVVARAAAPYVSDTDAVVSSLPTETNIASSLDTSPGESPETSQRDSRAECKSSQAPQRCSYKQLPLAALLSLGQDRFDAALAKATGGDSGRVRVCAETYTPALPGLPLGEPHPSLTGSATPPAGDLEDAPAPVSLALAPLLPYLRRVRASITALTPARVQDMAAPRCTRCAEWISPTSALVTQQDLASSLSGRLQRAREWTSPLDAPAEPSDQPLPLPWWCPGLCPACASPLGWQWRFALRLSDRGHEGDCEQGSVWVRAEGDAAATFFTALAPLQHALPSFSESGTEDAWTRLRQALTPPSGSSGGGDTDEEVWHAPDPLTFHPSLLQLPRLAGKLPREAAELCARARARVHCALLDLMAPLSVGTGSSTEGVEVRGRVRLVAAVHAYHRAVALVAADAQRKTEEAKSELQRAALSLEIIHADTQDEGCPLVVCCGVPLRVPLRSAPCGGFGVLLPSADKISTTTSSPSSAAAAAAAADAIETATAYFNLAPADPNRVLFSSAPTATVAADDGWSAPVAALVDTAAFFSPGFDSLSGTHGPATAGASENRGGLYRRARATSEINLEAPPSNGDEEEEGEEEQQDLLLVMNTEPSSPTDGEASSTGNETSFIGEAGTLLYDVFGNDGDDDWDICISDTAPHG